MLKKMFKIIEDCSPYYVRFTYEGIEKTIDLCKNSFKLDINELSKNFTFKTLDFKQSINIKNLSMPIQKLPQVDLNRFTYFVSEPGFYCPAHTDGPNHTWGINYSIQILDELCVTSWYDSKDLTQYDLVNGYSKLCKDFQKHKHTPLKTTTFKPNECVLINTGIFHDWDNSKSTNWRVVLTIRGLDVVYEKFNYTDVKNLLFSVN